jgi:hypothetical protein
VVFEDLLQLGPDWIVPLVAFRVGAGIDQHDEGFVDFHGWRVFRARAVSAKLFTGATEVLGKSGMGILPVITGDHRQDADAT